MSKETDLKINAVNQAQVSDMDAKFRLIAIGREHFGLKGLQGTTTREICHAAGLNISLISYHFGGKEGLYKAVISQFVEKASLEFKDVLLSFGSKPDLDPKDLLQNKEQYESFFRIIIARLLEVKFQDPYITMILFREMIEGLPYVRDYYEGQLIQIVTTIGGIIEHGQKKKIIKADINPYFLFVSLVHTIDTYYFIDKHKTSLVKKLYDMPADKEKLIEQLFLIYIRGILI